MKRSSSGKEKKINGILQWVKQAHDIEVDSNRISINIDESNIHEWDVVLTADMFQTSSKFSFEYLSDTGRYLLCHQEAQCAFQTLYDKWLQEHKTHALCFQIQESFYEAKVSTDGVYSQKNLSTDMMRCVRRIDAVSIADDIKAWFQKANNKSLMGVHLHFSFHTDFPHSPPFVRVIRPRFQQWTGHITIGGSMCTEMLTGSGWKPELNLIGLLLQLQNNIIEGQAKIDHTILYDYNEKEASEAYKRVARDHGWRISSYFKNS